VYFIQSKRFRPAEPYYDTDGHPLGCSSHAAMWSGLVVAGAIVIYGIVIVVELIF